MGVRVIASLFLVIFCFIKVSNTLVIRTNRQTLPDYYYKSKNLRFGNQLQSALPLDAQNLPSSPTNYLTYPVKKYQNSYGSDAVNYDNIYTPQYSIGSPTNYNNQYEEPSYSEEDTKSLGLTDEDVENPDQFLGSIKNYTNYKSSNSFNLVGQHQIETIDTKSYHKKSSPFNTANYKIEHHGEEQEAAEVHYHQHKHIHKHNHKQDHLHKHKQEHQHKHGHKHEHQGKHEHSHHGEHKHEHMGKHWHDHKSDHKHEHHQQHKHSHHSDHKHEHKHLQEHKHDHHHGHKHSHHSDHKHEHNQSHSHHHHHGHDHHSDHKHKHEHQHKHNHKQESKHQHGHKHMHKHTKH